jgi:glycylpeptide N-tetradecanoyltransferase
MYDRQIDVEKTVADVKDTPYNLPQGFEWADIDINDRTQADEVYKLLTQNYVEDDDNMFRFDYSIEFL